jgi:hypothetical protein
MRTIRTIWEIICMISQVQTAKKSLGTPISAWAAYRILHPKKAW